MHSRFKFKAEDFEQYFLDLMAGRRRNWYDRVLTDVLQDIADHVFLDAREKGQYNYIGIIKIVWF